MVDGVNVGSDPGIKVDFNVCFDSGSSLGAFVGFDSGSDSRAIAGVDGADGGVDSRSDCGSVDGVVEEVDVLVEGVNVDFISGSDFDNDVRLDVDSGSDPRAIASVDGADLVFDV